MARLLIATYSGAYHIQGDQSATEYIAKRLPDDGEILDPPNSYFGRYRTVRLSLTHIPHMDIDWTNDSMSQTDDRYHAISLFGVTDREFQQLQDTLSLPVYAQGDQPEFKAERVSDTEVRIWRTGFKDADTPCLFFVLDEDEDKDMLFAGPEAAFQAFVPMYARVSIRSREQRMFGVPITSRAHYRSIYCGMFLNRMPGGNNFLPVTHRKVMDEFRAIMTGDSRSCPGPGGLTLWLREITPARNIFGDHTIKQMMKARKQFLSRCLFETSCSSLNTGKRNLCLGDSHRIDKDYFLHMKPPGDAAENDYGALAFCFNKDFTKLEKPVFKHFSKHQPERGVETLVSAERPCLIVAANSWGWIGLAIIPVTTQVDPYPFQSKMQGITHFLNYQNDVYGKMNYAMCIPICYDHATLAEVGTRNRTAPGLDASSNAAVKRVPYMGHFLTDCLMTVKGQMKTVYNDPGNVDKLGQGHFAITFTLPSAESLTDSRGDTVARSYMPSRYQQSATYVNVAGLNNVSYRLLAGPSGALQHDSRFFTFCRPETRSGIPREVIPNAMTMVPASVQPGARPRNRILDL